MREEPPSPVLEAEQSQWTEEALEKGLSKRPGRKQEEGKARVEFVCWGSSLSTGWEKIRNQRRLVRRGPHLGKRWLKAWP